MNEKRLTSMFASAMVARVDLKEKIQNPQSQSPPPVDVILSNEEHFPPQSTDDTITAAELSLPDDHPLQLSTNTPSSNSGGSLSLPPQHETSLSQSSCSAFEDMLHTVKNQIIHDIGHAESMEEVQSYDFIYLFDTGGQQAFHAIIPLFYPKVMFVIFVLKLSEQLDFHPKVYYFVNGKPIGAPYTSPMSNLQIAKRSFMALQSQMLAQQLSKEGFPKLMVIGTHRDKRRQCAESVEEKNCKLMEILSPSLQDHLVYHSAQENDLIFQLDAKHRKAKDRQMAAKIRHTISATASKISSKQTPFSWHVLELALRQLTDRLGRGFLTYAECVEEATKLQITEVVFGAALKHFVGLNTMLHYPSILPNVVFIQAQPLMEKMNELIQKHHSLSGEVSVGSEHAAVEGKWLKFRDQGMISLDILESFPQGYHEGVFTATDLLNLMKYKLLVSAVDQSSFFMPCLLPSLKEDEMSKHRVHSDSAISPLSITFGSSLQLVPNGLFCALVSSLLSGSDSPHLQLKTSPSNSKCMECVAFNCIKFFLEEYAASLVLIDAYTHFELHLHAPRIKDPSQLCLALKVKVLASIQTAAHMLHYDELKPQCGFLCESTTPHAMKRLTPDQSWLRKKFFSSPNPVESPPPVHCALILSSEHGWSCSLDPDIVHGELQKRHIVWLSDQQPGKFFALGYSIYTI